MTWPLITVVALALLAWAVLAGLVGNPRTSALAVTAVFVSTLSGATLTRLAEQLQAPLVVPLAMILVFLVCISVLRSRSHVHGLTRFANVLLLTCTILVAWPIVFSEFRRWKLPTPEYGALDPGADRSAANRPDIYVLVLDGYGRADVLRDTYGFDNDLVPALESLGFFVASGASSNYAQTAPSLASFLNLDYLSSLLPAHTEDDVPTRRRLGDLIARNRTFASLRSAGYRIRAYASEYSLIRPQQVDEVRHAWPMLTSFDYGLYEDSLLPRASMALGIPRSLPPLAAHRRQVNWALNDLLRSPPAGSDPPTLVFAHLLVPHPPFAFAADGQPRPVRSPSTLQDGSLWHAMAGDGDSYEAGYVSSVRFLNRPITELAQRLARRDNGRDAIVFLLGDHGPGSKLQWENPAATDVRERLGNLLAVRFPDGSAAGMHSSITPVNAFRVLMNRVLGTGLPLLEDRAYFSTWSKPWQFIDVTDRVR